MLIAAWTTWQDHILMFVSNRPFTHHQVQFCVNCVIYGARLTNPETRSRWQELVEHPWESYHHTNSPHVPGVWSPAAESASTGSYCTIKSNEKIKIRWNTVIFPRSSSSLCSLTPLCYLSLSSLLFTMCVYFPLQLFFSQIRKQPRLNTHTHT